MAQGILERITALRDPIKQTTSPETSVLGWTLVCVPLWQPKKLRKKPQKNTQPRYQPYIKCYVMIGMFTRRGLSHLYQDTGLEGSGLKY